MKKFALTVVFVFLGTALLSAQEVAGVKKNLKKESKKIVATKSSTNVVEGPGLVFDKETIDYGTIAHNADGNREFTFINNGTKPLIISNTQGSCGCTVPTSPKDPIPPGGKGKIGVHYATDRIGAFTKTITVTSNAVGAESKLITIKGNVLGDETAVSPLTPKS